MAIKPGTLHEAVEHQDPHEPDWWSMSEAEIMARQIRQEDGNMLEIPPYLAPAGWKYEWKTYSVNNMPDRDNIARAEANGWRSVMQSRHDGRWMAPGTEGPVIYKGLMLMELPEPVHDVRRKLAKREADAQTAGLRERMRYTPPGSAERLEPTLRHKTLAPGEYELAVER